MTKLLLTILMAVGISGASPVAKPAIEAPAAPECIAPEQDPEPMSCKASGHACEDAEECCSRQCLKKEKKCG